MNRWQDFHIDLLSLVFDHLTRRDLVQCSYTCWAWNMMASVHLYQYVQPRNRNYLDKLIRTISESQPNISDPANATKRSRQLGQLVKDVTLIYLHGFRHSSGYPTRLMKFAQFTSNVHTATIDYPHINFASEYASRFDWEEHVGSKWPHLKNLTLRSHERFKYSVPHLSSMETVLYRLHKLDTLSWSEFLYYLPQSPPAMKNLQTLKVTIPNKTSYEHLKRLLQTCRNTLRSLSITWDITAATHHPPLSLGDFIKELPHLKNFTLVYKYDHIFTIGSFGDQLEYLTLRASFVERDSPVYEVVANAVSKTSNLKKLEIRYCTHIEKYIHRIIEANKSTLQEIFMASRNSVKLISNMIDNSTQADNITTLGFYFVQDNLQLVDLAKVFPRVEWLSLPDLIFSGSNRWIEEESISQFRHLKGIDWLTFAQLIDPYECKYARVHMDWNQL
jgi:F-box domain